MKLWPHPIQRKLQASFDQEDGVYWADFPELFPKGERMVFCGDCGKRGATNPENDICVECEQKLALGKQQ